MELFIFNTWQDFVLGAGQLFFFVALIPSIISKEKPHAGTSAMTSLVLTVFAGTFWSLGLLFGAGAALLIATGWYVLFFQKVFSKKQAEQVSSSEE